MLEVARETGMTAARPPARRGRRTPPPLLPGTGDETGPGAGEAACWSPPRRRRGRPPRRPARRRNPARRRRPVPRAHRRDRRLPKVAAHTHAKQLASSRDIALASGSRARDAVLGGLPLFHVNALLVTGVAPRVRRRARRVAGPLGYRGRTCTPGSGGSSRTPDHGDVRHAHRLRCVDQVPIDADIGWLALPSSAPRRCRRPYARGSRRHTGVRLLEGYGLTEATCASAFTPFGGERNGSVGRSSEPAGRGGARSRDDRLLDRLRAGRGRAASDRRPHRVRRLVTDPALAAPGHARGDGPRRLARHGDLGSVNADGYVYLTGRAKDLIIRGGHNIDPDGDRGGAAAAPSVVAAAAVGRPDRHCGKVPVAYVVPEDPDASTRPSSSPGRRARSRSEPTGRSGFAPSPPSRRRRRASTSSPRSSPTPPSRPSARPRRSPARTRPRDHRRPPGRPA